MKKLMYLAITFFTFIFSFIAPIKNNFNININNNKLVEKLNPKKAFVNAPQKDTSLPGFNKEFKIFFNISNLNELNDFHDSLDFNNKIYFIGESTGEDSSIIQFYYMHTNPVNNKFSVTAAYIQDTSIYPVTMFEFSKVNNVLNYASAVGGNNGEITSDNVVNEIFTGINETIKDTFFSSINSVVPLGNVFGEISVNANFNNNYIYGYDVVESSAVPGLISTISSIATGLLSLLISLFSSVVAIFWNVSNNTPTFLGVVILFIVAVPITYWVINFVIGLIRKIRLTRGK